MKLNATIGAVEFAEDSVRIAVVKTGAKTPTVLQTVEVTVVASEHDAKVSALRTAIGRLDDLPSVYVLCVPASWTVLRQLTVPFRGRRKVAAAVPFELEPCLAIPIEDLAIDFLTTKTNSDGTDVIAIGVQRNMLDEHCAILEEAGISPEAATLDALALTSLWHATHPPESGTRAVLHLREQDSTLLVLEDKKLLAMRRVSTSARSIRNDPSAAGRELANLFRAVASEQQTKSPLESLAVTGSNLLEAGQTLFENEFDYPIQYDDLASTLSGIDLASLEQSNIVPGQSVDEENSWSAPIAVAASGAGGPFAVNFLQGQFASEGTRKTLATYGITATILAIGVVVTFFALAYIDYRNTLADIDRIGKATWKEFTATYPDAGLTRPQGDIGGFKSFELMQLAAEEERENTSSLTLDQYNRPTMLDVIDEFTRFFPASVAVIQEIKISTARKMTVTISGDIQNSERFNAAINGISKSGKFTLSANSPQRISQGGKETFVLTATR